MMIKEKRKKTGKVINKQKQKKKRETFNEEAEIGLVTKILKTCERKVEDGSCAFSMK